jgi:glycosyltransferase involved in cell wall biosynthesis
MFVGRNNYFSDYGIKKFLKTNSIDVVLSNYGISAAHMVPPCKALGIPLIPVFRGHDATDEKLLSKYRDKYSKLFEYASYLAVVSVSLQSQLVQMGADPDKIRIIPSGVNTSKFQPNHDIPQRNHFLSVGRFTTKKGPMHTISAFSLLHHKFPEARLTLVGKKDGVYTQCEKLVRELGLEASVQFTGILDHHEVAELMRSALGFVQHSITAPNGDSEGTPVGVMEASASGLPVVSTRHGGIREAVIHEKTGFLVEEGDWNGMAQHMAELWENPDLAREMGLNGRKHMQNNYEQAHQHLKLLELCRLAINK